MRPRPGPAVSWDVSSARASFVVLVVLVAACLDEDLAGRRCDEVHACIDGYVCVDGRCATPGAGEGEGEGEGEGDAGFVDAGFVDAGFVDAGFADAGFADAGSADAGFADAGFDDAGFVDAGPADAGAPVPDVDAGALILRDDFADGVIAAQWSLVGGAWTEDAVLNQNDKVGRATATRTDVSATDVIVESAGRFKDGPLNVYPNGLYVVARATGATSGVACGFARTSATTATAGLFDLTSGASTPIQTLPLEPVPGANADVTWRLVAHGDGFRCTVTPTLPAGAAVTVTATIPGRGAGSIAVATEDAKGEWDFVQVNAVAP